MDFWVVDTKCKVLPESSLPQDGSEYYYGRSAVPAADKEQAVAKLATALEEDHIFIESVLDALRFQDGEWDEEDDFEVHDSFEQAELSSEIGFGCFISEKSR